MIHKITLTDEQIKTVLRQLSPAGSHYASMNEWCVVLEARRVMLRAIDPTFDSQEIEQ